MMRMRFADHIWAHTPLRWQLLSEGAKILLWPYLFQILVPRRSLSLLLGIKGKIKLMEYHRVDLKEFFGSKTTPLEFFDDFCSCVIKYISLFKAKILLCGLVSFCLFCFFVCFLFCFFFSFVFTSDCPNRIALLLCFSLQLGRSLFTVLHRLN